MIPLPPRGVSLMGLGALNFRKNVPASLPFLASASPSMEPLAWEACAVKQIRLLRIWRAWSGDVQLTNVRSR